MKIEEDNCLNTSEDSISDLEQFSIQDIAEDDNDDDYEFC